MADNSVITSSYPCSIFAVVVQHSNSPADSRRRKAAGNNQVQRIVISFYFIATNTLNHSNSGKALIVIFLNFAFRHISSHCLKLIQYSPSFKICFLPLSYIRLNASIPPSCIARANSFFKQSIIKEMIN